MPVEIVSSVLLLMCGVFENSPRQFLLSRLILLEVCAYWRAVVCSDPRFWSNLFIGDCRTLPNLDLWLSRARGAKLHLFVDTGSYADDSRSFTRLWCSLLDLLPVIAERIARFSLLDRHGDRGAVLLRCMSNLAASAVSRLDVSTVSTTEIDERVVEHGRWGRYLSGTSVPLKLLPSASITSLLVRRAFLVLHSSMLSGVTHLMLGPFPSDHRLAWSSVRAMLLSCTALTLFVCDDVRCEYGPFEICDLPSLTHLRFISRDWSADYIFSVLRMPHLRILSLDGSLPSLGSVGSTSTSPSYTSVEHLVLDCPIPSDTDFVHILRPFVNLTSLDLRRMPAESVTAFLAVRKDMLAEAQHVGEHLCPSLSSVHVGVPLSASESAGVLEDVHRGVFSPGCTLNHVASSCAGGAARVEGAFRMVDGRVVSSAYLEPVETCDLFDDSFCG
ncbi:hypothetical protein R3P38DRAFT_3182007 [Favolaschia claudopus]|uniref:F-box domain-containing protein n=1 Tax=Favolaschia claudopus TaxID=2862362 RepID=A0AAW0CG96_9AGAR